MSNATRPAPDAPPAVSASMLFKFRTDGGPLLGRASVTALAPVLTEIEAEVWLAAMGVPVAERPAPEAGA